MTTEEKTLLTGQVAQTLREDPRTIRRWAAVFSEYLTCNRPNQTRRQFSEKDIQLLRRIQWMLRDEGMTTDQIGVLLAEERQAGICVELPEDEEFHASEAESPSQDVTPAAVSAYQDVVESHETGHTDHSPRLRVPTKAITVWRRRIKSLQDEVVQLRHAYADLQTQWEGLGEKYDRLHEILQAKEFVPQHDTPRITFDPDDAREATRMESIAQMELLSEAEQMMRTERVARTESATQDLPPRGGVRRFKRRRHHGLLSWFVGVLS